MNTLSIIFLLICSLYAIRILSFRRQWILTPEFFTTGDAGFMPLSVIIPFRNEYYNLPVLLQSLESQSLSSDAFEVLLINDHSEDGSEFLAAEFCRKHANYRLLFNKGIPGKKSALTLGIKNAKHEYIVTTDADCTHPIQWLKTLGIYAGLHHPDMIIGLVDLKVAKGFFNRFQEIEFLSIIAAGAGAAAGNGPIYCSAASLAFRRCLFLERTDPMRMNIPSGDDTLFMFNLKKEGRQKIMLIKSQNTIVTTIGTTTLSDFLSQRKRWISKSRHYRDRDALFTAILVLAMNMALLASMVIALIHLNFRLLPLIFIVKTMADFYLLRSFLVFYNKQISFLPFVVFEMIYPFYSIFIALTGLLTGYRWKGRRFDPGSKGSRS
jgi:poly-beta-1,6-N-acetyl-D-glucosamine synthase